jgi:hypothetical protein
VRVLPATSVTALCLLVAPAVGQHPVAPEAPAPTAEQVRAHQALVVDVDLEPAGRCAALGWLLDSGVLDDTTLAAALFSEDAGLRRQAVAILRHLRPVWPPALLAGLAGHEHARQELLRELAMAPRPGLETWIEARLGREGISDAERVLCLAARIAPPDVDEAKWLLQCAAEGASSEVGLAIGRIPPDVADSVVSATESLLVSPAVVDRLWPFFEGLARRSSAGVFAVADRLDAPVRLALYERISGIDSAELRERARAALDGEIPLAAEWLLAAAPLMQDRARQDRVLQFLVNPASPLQARIRAFDLLLGVGRYEEGMGRFALEDPRRVVRLLAARIDLPDSLLLEAMDERSSGFGKLPPTVGVFATLLRRPFGPAVEDRLIAFLTTEQSTIGMRPMLARALCAGGSDRGVGVMLGVVRYWRESEREELYSQLARRRDPIAATALRTELVDPMRGVDSEVRQAVRAHIRLALSEHGDRRARSEFFQAIAGYDAALLRRARNALPELAASEVEQLLDALPAYGEAEARVEVMLWLGHSPQQRWRDALLKLWEEAEDEEEREVAMRLLLAGPERPQVVAAWKNGELDELWSSLVAYGLLAAMPDELRDEDVGLLRDLLFDLPRRDVEAERRRAAEFPDGRTGFPVVAAVAETMRRGGVKAFDVCRVAADLVAGGELSGLTRQRLLCLWASLQAEPELMQAVARQTAALVLALEDGGDAGRPAASYFLGQQLQAEGRHDAAAHAYEVAARGLLCDPEQRFALRLLLGSRDPLLGRDPHAALAAASHLQRARQAVLDGDAAALDLALRLAAEFAGRDEASLLAVRAMVEKRDR